MSGALRWGSYGMTKPRGIRGYDETETLSPGSSESVVGSIPAGESFSAEMFAHSVAFCVDVRCLGGHPAMGVHQWPAAVSASASELLVTITVVAGIEP